MAYSNHYKDQVEGVGKKSSKKAKKEKAPKGEKTKRSLPKPSLDGLGKIGALLKDERTRNILGIFLILLSGILLLSLTSYIFTWKVDQDKLFNKSWLDVLLNPEIEIDNWLGTFGALISHQLINNGFGISSVVFVLITFLIGFKVLFKVELLPFWRTVGISTFFLIWTSILMGSLFYENFLFLGGAFGYHTNQWLTGVIGQVGTGLILFFAFAVFAIVTFNLSIAGLIASVTSLEDPAPPIIKPKSQEEDIESENDIKSDDQDE